MSRTKTSLLDIMSEQLAHGLQSEPAIEFEDEALFLGLDSRSEEPAFPHQENGNDEDEAFALDLALALQLQEEEDAILLSESLPSSHYPQGNVTIKRFAAPVLGKLRPAAYVDLEDEEEQVGLPVFFRDKTLKGQGGNGEIITKHDSALNRKKNAVSLDKFVPANQCGNSIASHGLSNQAYNSLSQQVKRQQDRSYSVSGVNDGGGNFGKGLNRKTTRILQNLINAHVIDRVGGIVRSGKEANIFHCELDLGKVSLAVKVYKTNAQEFSNRVEYIAGDHRFQDFALGRMSEDKIVALWAEKELKNLSRLQDAGVPAPRPIRLVKNVLVMEFISDGGGVMGAPQLAEIKFTSNNARQECLLQCLLLMRALWERCALVHADMSEYNVLLDGGGRCVLVDVAQAVDLTHPRATEFLQRDVRNVLRFFSHSKADSVGGVDNGELVSLVASWIQGEQLPDGDGGHEFWVDFAAGLGSWVDLAAVPKFASVL
ncbi:hypothetical protein BASA81_003797 [Batrachochytrium salamandrivorans]|nr:hypothetical protein BASA81_003797 [Batrachochytrium salamandrivorans]